MVPPPNLNSENWHLDTAASKWFWYCLTCNYDYDEGAHCLCKTPEKVKAYQNPKGKGGKGQRKGTQESMTGAGAAASPLAAAAHETPQVFRDAAMRNAAAKIRSDTALASATPPFPWQETQHGEKPLESDLLLPLHRKDARAQARKPQFNNQWLTPFGSSNGSGSFALSFLADGQVFSEHYVLSEQDQEEDEFA